MHRLRRQGRLRYVVMHSTPVLPTRTHREEGLGKGAEFIRDEGGEEALADNGVDDDAKQQDHPVARGRGPEVKKIRA